MSDFSSWSLYCGRWSRLRVRVHALFLLTAVFTLLLSTGLGANDEAVGYGIAGVLILLLSVVAHELGHCYAAARVGGNPEQIVIGPLGGLAPAEVPREPQAELITACAGPVINLGVLLLVLPLLWAAGIGVTGLLHPLAPATLIEGTGWQTALRLIFWVNWLLLIVNLLPAYPFDGARILRSLLVPSLDHRSAALVVVRTSKLTALAACILAWLLHDPDRAAVIPAWLPLVLLALFIYFCAQHEQSRSEEGQWEDDLLSYDFSQGYTSLDRSIERSGSPGHSMRRWLERRKEMRRRKLKSQEQDEERQVDEILTRLHETGMQGLTAKERALLNRVSARYRNRQRS